MFERIAALSIRWPRAVLAFSVIMVGLAGYYAVGIGSSLTTDNGFIVKGSESDRVATVLADKFKTDTTSGIVLFTGKNGLAATDPKFRAETNRILSTIAGDGVTVIADQGVAATAALISTDGSKSYAVIKVHGTLQEQYDRLAGWYREASSTLVSMQLGGPSVAQHQSQDRVEKDLQRAELISFPILAVLLLVIFRSVIAAMLPLVLGVVAIIGGLAVTRLLAHVTPVDQYSVNVITILGLGLSVDYSLLMVSRFREELEALTPGGEIRTAVRRTVLTSGRTIFFSGLTVIASLLTLLVFPIGFLHSIALGGASAIMMAVLAALIILPSLLHLLGPSLNRFQIIHPRRKADDAKTVWHRLGQFAVSKPWWSIIGSVMVITALAYPVIQTKFVTQTFHFLPAGSSSRDVAAVLDSNFANQGERVDIIVHLGQPASSAAGQKALASVAQQSRDVAGVTSVSEPQTNGTTAAIVATTSNDDAVARAVVTDLRKITEPTATVEVGGISAALNDTLNALYTYAPIAIGLILIAMFVLLGLLVRSVVIPLQAVVINSFALLAAMGVLVYVFQQDHLGPLTWLSPTFGLDPTIPVLILSIAFGLSMDYGAFLYSRMREEYDRTGDTSKAIITSLERTGGIITAAAVLLVVVVGAFTSSASSYIEQVGVGLSVGILVDAFVVRLFLVPAVMHQFGRLNWYGPKWLDRYQIKHN